MKAIDYPSSGIGTSLFSATKTEFKQRGFEDLSGWAGASAYPEKVLRQLKAPSGFFTKSLLELFYYV